MKKTNLFGGGATVGGTLAVLLVLAGCQTVATQKIDEKQVSTTQSEQAPDTKVQQNVDFKDREFTSVIHIYGNLVTYPMPAWFKPESEKDIFEQSKYFRDQKGPQFIYEQIPADQDFDDWEEIYIVSGLLLGKDVPVQRVIDLYLAGFKQGCLNGEVKSYQVSNPENTLVAFCEEFDGASGLQGTQKGLGEIMVKRQFVSNGAVVSVTHEWRGPAFDYRDSASWPASEDEIDAMLERFKSIEVMHPGLVGG
ncbi:MAG: hypothetical protein RIG26_09850 [Thalassospira sp.]|uniref:hypothetical protein n=1 Tax=Thalassospira sp. TaxID=1912094 RepID=UPI0032F04713